MSQEQGWQAGGRSPQCPRCPHGAQAIPTAPRAHGDSCNTEPTLSPTASLPENHLPIPLEPAQHLQQDYSHFLYRKRIAFGGRVEVWPPPASLHHFFGILFPTSEKLRVPEASHFSALKGVVAKSKCIKIFLCKYNCSDPVSMCIARGWDISSGHQQPLLSLFHKTKQCRGCPGL